MTAPQQLAPGLPAEPWMLTYQQYARGKRPLGVTPRPTTVYRVSREIPDGYWLQTADGARFVQSGVRTETTTCFREWDAYRQLARWMIQVKREQHVAPDGHSCLLCESTEPQHGYDYEDPALCRYHDDEPYHRLEHRLARWLRWRDRRRTAQEGDPP